MWRTRVCEILGIRYPIVEGGMTIAGNGELAAAVSNAGGLGMIGTNPGWSPPDKHVENLRSHIRKCKSLTNKPFGVNFTLFAMEQRAKALLEMAIEEGVKIAVTSGGNPKLYTRLLKDAGLKVMHVVGNSRQAKGAEDAGVDIVAAEGYEAGGVNSPDELTTMVLIPYVVDSVKIPVIAAGGICDARGFIAALALGAEGVQMGSRFIAAKECHGHDNYKNAVVSAKDTDTIITRRNLGLRVRSLKNEYTIKLEEMDRIGTSAEKIQYFMGFGTAVEGMMLGDAVKGDLNIGQNAGMLKKVLSASEIINNIIADAEKIITRCNSIHKL